MPEFREDKDGRLQFKPPTEAQWADAVECYQRNKVQGTLELLGGGE